MSSSMNTCTTFAPAVTLSSRTAMAGDQTAGMAGCVIPDRLKYNPSAIGREVGLVDVMSGIKDHPNRQGLSMGAA